MIDSGKRNLLGVLVDVIDYDAATARVIDAAQTATPLALTALAVHGLMEAVDDPEFRHRINHLDIVTPDGQPVRWSLDRLHAAALDDRCYGPTLMRHVCAAAAVAGVPIHLYGSTAEVLAGLAVRLREDHPGLVIAGTAPSRFATVDGDALDVIAAQIVASGARIVFVGLGCPRQEIFAYEMRDRLGIPVLAVGAAFEYHAGLRREPPAWVQRAGLQWLWRLAGDPRRLWRRYARTNPRFVVGILRQRFGRSVSVDSARPPAHEIGHA